MAAALIFALLLAQGGAAPAAGAASASVSADQIGDAPPAGGASVSLSEPPALRSVSGAQLFARTHDARATGQVGAPVRSTAAPDQLTARRRTASAPPALSSRREGRNVSVVVVHGHDRCDPVKGEATQEECAAILDNRADQFARPSAPAPTPEDVLVGSPPSTAVASDAGVAARRLAGPGGGDPNAAVAAAETEASLAGFDAATAAAGAQDRSPPAVPPGVTALLNGAGVTSAPGVVVTVTPPPK